MNRTTRFLLLTGGSTGGAAPPGPPTSLAVTAATSTTITLTFTPPAGSGLTFNLYQGTTPGGESGTPVQTGVAVPTFTETGLTAGTTYYFVVKAVNVNGVGAASNEAGETTYPAPVGYWPSSANTFQDTAGSTPATAQSDPVARDNDASAGGNNMLQATGAKRPLLNLVPWGDGTYKELLYNGTSQFLKAGNVTAMNFERTDHFACFATVRVTSFSADGWIVGKADSTSTADGYSLIVDSATKKLRVQIAGGDGSHVADARGSTVLSLGTPYSVGFTYDGSSTAAGIQIWLNGVKETMTTIQDNLGSNSIQNTGNVAIGARSDNTPNQAVFFAGGISAPTIYSGAMTDAQVQQQMKQMMADAGLVLIASTVVGTPLVLTPVIALPSGNATTYSCSDATFVKSDTNVFTYTSIFEDGGTVRAITITGTDGTFTRTRSYNIYTMPNFAALANDAADPILGPGGAGTYNVGGVGEPNWGPLDVIGDVVYGVAVTNGPSNSNIALAQTTLSSNLKTWTYTGGNPAIAGGAAPLFSPNHATRSFHLPGLAGGDYSRYYSAQDTHWKVRRMAAAAPSSAPGSWSDQGAVITTVWPTYTQGSGQVSADYGPDGTTIYMYVCDVAETASNLGEGIYRFTSTNGTTWTQGELAVGKANMNSADWDSGTSGFFDAGLSLGPYGAYELCYSVTYAGPIVQKGAYALSKNGKPPWVKYQAAAYLNANVDGQWDGHACGDLQLHRYKNYLYAFNSGSPQPQSAPTPGYAGFRIMQSPTTGHFIGLATTTYSTGETIYSVSPNGYTAANMTAVPASGTVTITVTAYAAGGVTMTVVGTVAVAVAFTLNGMTINHAYTVKLNGSTVATPTSNGSGVLTFSVTPTGGTDTVTVT